MIDYNEAQWNVIGGIVNPGTREDVLCAGVNIGWFDGELSPIASEVIKHPRGWVKTYPTGQAIGDKILNYSSHVTNVDFWVDELGAQYKRSAQGALMAQGADIAKEGGDYTNILDQVNSLNDVGVLVEEKKDYLQDFIQMNENKGAMIPTPFPRINDKAPINIGDFVIVCGRPSAGKTSFVSQTMLTAEHEGNRILYFCLDDPYKICLKKFGAQISGKEGNYLDRNPRGPEVKKAMDHLYNSKIHIVSNITRIEGICSYVAKFKARHPDLSMVVVDHVTKVQSKGNSAYERATFTSQELFSLTKRHNIAVIALSQLNRSIESEKRAVRMSDLRDSGSLEEDATMIYSFYTEVDKKDPKAEGVLHINGFPYSWPVIMGVIKNKDGPTLEFGLNLTGPTFTFTEGEAK
jgi:replicative DNA helicase